MTNQAAQTMPELPKSDQWGFEQQSWLYTADQMHQYARDYAAMLAAAPAASGVDTSTNEAWAARAQEKIAAMDAASVSERARSASLKEIVPAEKRNYLDDNGNPRSIEDEAYAHGWNACRAATLRALEQALTQQRGECGAVAWQVEWIDNAGDPTRYIAYCEEDADDKLGVLSDGEAATAKVIPLYTTPQPGAEALRELATEWRRVAQKFHDMGSSISIAEGAVMRNLAGELESLLARGGK